MEWESNAAGVIADPRTDLSVQSGMPREFFVSDGNLSDLEEGFSQAREEFAQHAEVRFRVIVEGTPRPLRSTISDEVYLIGHEALANAFRHSRARDVEVELEYAATHLRVLIRDDGCGIDPKVLSSGRFGHWGLSDMTERAARIGGRLRVLSHATAGTEIELTLPGQVAYEAREDDRSVRWLTRLFS